VPSTASTLGDQDPDDFYDAAPLEPHLVYQGEVLFDVPILSMSKPPCWQLLRTRSGRRVDEALEHGNLGGLVKVLDSNLSKEEWQADNRGDFAMAILDKNPVLVLNQTCDVQTNDFLQVAPIFPANTSADHFARLRAGDIYSAFWLPPHLPVIPVDSYADLELIQAVHKSYFRRAAHHFRLSPQRTRALQRTVTHYFGRPNSFDSRSDHVPRTGTYLCVSCFYMRGSITAASLEEGASFPTCQTCGPTQWILRGR
jgi:hypothetical protein